MRHSLFVSIAAIAIATPHLAAAEQATVREPGFELVVTSPPALRVSSPAELVVSVRPTDGRKLNQEYPLKIEVRAPTDVDVAKARLDRSDARSMDEHGARFPITATARAAGDKELLVDVRFAVCTEANCEPYRRTVKLALRAR